MKQSKYTLGLIQLDTQKDKDDNLARIEKLVERAVEQKVSIVSLPEVFNVIDGHIEPPESIENGKTINFMKELAKKHNIFIHCGSILEEDPEGGKPYNTTAVLDPSGKIVAKYRKLHLFDVTLPDGERKGESDRIQPGNEIVSFDTDLGRFGLTICYDIRFAELFKILALEGSEVIFVPANFTVPTGKDHWEALLKTRAIENGCYVVASAQIGVKPNGSPSFGASLVVDPWGTVIAKAPEKECVLVAEIDLSEVERIRGLIPSLKNRRSDIYDVVNKA